VIIVVPGLAVRRYLEDAVAAVSRRGHEVRMPAAPGAPGTEPDLRRYGEELAGTLARADVLLAVSVGCQAAAVAAAAVPVRRLVLISPTVDPRVRSWPALAGAWLRGTGDEPPRLGLEQLPDWRRAGARRLAAVVRSALRERLEDTLPRVASPVTVVHGEHDSITSHAYAAALAAAPGRDLVVVPGATHSWPYGDGARFADLVDELAR
jgi:pimeloyl-ACP methyl ester carboxylesterase